jgi:AcrR family transcriptional regulator
VERRRKMQKKNEKGLSVVQQKAVALIVTKDINGMTVADVAKELKVGVSTIYFWQREDENFIKELNRQAEKLLDAFMPECYSILQKIILDEKEPTKNKLIAIDKIMKIKGKYVDKYSVEVSQQQSKSPEDLKREVIELEQDLIADGVLEEARGRSRYTELDLLELEVLKHERDLLA